MPEIKRIDPKEYIEARSEHSGSTPSEQRTTIQINVDKEAIEEHVRDLVAPSLEAAADLADEVDAFLNRPRIGVRNWGDIVLSAQPVREAVERYRATSAHLVGGGPAS
jgi:hypothetical protein